MYRHDADDHRRRRDANPCRPHAARRVRADREVRRDNRSRADAWQRRYAIGHLAPRAVSEAGRPYRRPAGGPQCPLSRRAQGARAARRLDGALGRLLARPLRQSQNTDEGDRSMNDAALKSATQDIVVEEVFPHAPESIWKALTTGELIGRWLMKPTGFEPMEGKRFTFQTKPAGAWDGVIHCRVLEATPKQRLVYAWKGGHEENVGYGRPLAPAAPSPPPHPG